MNETTDPAAEKIVLSREEAMSPRVDDLLSRHRSLAGEPGIRRESGAARWYLQNWFLFGLAGALAAFVVWVALEPMYDDYLYVEGRVERLDLETPLPEMATIGALSFPTHQQGWGWVEIPGQRIWISATAQQVRDGQTASFGLDELRVGQELGFYVHYLSVTDVEGFAVAEFIDFAPPRPAPPKARLSLAKSFKRDRIAGVLFFPLIAGAIGLAVGAVEGLVCRQFRRAVQAGAVGLLVGLFGGLLVYFPSEILYGSIVALRSGIESPPGSFFVQMVGRALSWTLAGTAMGLGQGIALRSKRLLVYGFLGGVVGGLLGGLLFDPIETFVQGGNHPSAHLSRMIGFTAIGLSVGLMIGLVQILARDAWLRMVEGPLAGKEFLLFKDRMLIGAARECELFLFNDPDVLPRHAVLHAVGDDWEIESLNRDQPVQVNDRAVGRSRVRHGNRITIGKTSFIIRMKRS